MIGLFLVLIFLFFAFGGERLLRRRRRPPSQEEIVEVLRANPYLTDHAAWTKILDQQPRRDSSDWWSSYSRYLESPEWQVRRSRILARDGFVCRQCRFHAATQVHHLTYARVGHELDEDLISVCDACHDQFHSQKGRRLRRL
jgi:5-methylcytosine-specific restriction endonuclease McrA